MMLYKYCGTNWIYYIYCIVINVILADNFFTTHPVGFTQSILQVRPYIDINSIFIWMNMTKNTYLCTMPHHDGEEVWLCVCVIIIVENVLHNVLHIRVVQSCTLLYPVHLIMCLVNWLNNLMALPWTNLKTTHQNSFVSFRYTMLVILSKVYHFIVSNQQENPMQSWGYESAATSSKKETSLRDIASHAI